MRSHLILFMSAVLAHASTTYISETGPDGGNFTVEPSQTLVESWTQSVTLTNVQISADLAADGGLPTGTAYLTTALGPGSTSAANQIAVNTSAPFAIGATPAFEVLFSGLALGPGTYYLVITGPGPNPSDNNFWEGASPVSEVTAPGVSYGAVFQSSGTGETEAGYLPSASFANLGSAFTLQFIVNDASVPEPAAWLLAGAGLLALGMARPRNRRR